MASITFWDLTTGATIGSGSEVTIALNMVYSLDGSLLFSVSHNNLLIWRTTDGELVLEVSSPAEDIYALAMSDDGSLIATKSRGGVIILWGLPQE